MEGRAICRGMECLGNRNKGSGQWRGIRWGKWEWRRVVSEWKVRIIIIIR